MAARTAFPKKDGKICALVPQKTRVWAVTSLEININSRSGKKLMAAHYDQDQKEPYFNKEESPD